jgi:MFS family permease
MYLVMYIDRVNIATVAPRMTADLGLNNTQFGLAISAFSYPYALFQLIGGWVSDRFGPRRALLLSGLVVCVATACTGLVGGLGSLIAARVVLGFGEGSAFPTATRALSVWMPRARWGFAQGITHSASRLGNVLTPPLIVGLMAYTSWRGSFVALGLRAWVGSPFGGGSFAMIRASISASRLKSWTRLPPAPSRSQRQRALGALA